MRCLLILHAGGPNGSTRSLVEAAQEGARGAEPALPCRAISAIEAGPEHVLGAGALLFATPEKFGYMAGTLKDFFDRSFYPLEGRVAGLAYGLMVCAGNDGSGAVEAVERIVRGWSLRSVAEPMRVVGPPTQADLEKARSLGALLASGVAMGIF
jgi:multimeric flavodoxin WrbA